MAIISAFCKKGGVGKTTFIGYFAHFLTTKGKKVLILSADDQNSIFKVFGADDKIFEPDDNYLEYFFTGHADLGDLLVEVRNNLFLIKTLNTDMLSNMTTQKRSYEKAIKKMLEEYESFFDYVFIDFPPSGNRLTEIFLEFSDTIMIVVGLDSLGIGGFVNTIQYFIDNDLSLDNIAYIIPIGYSKNRRAPRISLDKLIGQAKDFVPDAKVLPAIQDRAIIKNLQSEGVSPYDESPTLSPYDKNCRDALIVELNSLFEKIKI